MIEYTTLTTLSAAARPAGGRGAVGQAKVSLADFIAAVRLTCTSLRAMRLLASTAYVQMRVHEAFAKLGFDTGLWWSNMPKLKIDEAGDFGNDLLMMIPCGHNSSGGSITPWWQCPAVPENSHVFPVAEAVFQDNNKAELTFKYLILVISKNTADFKVTYPLTLNRRYLRRLHGAP